jgi:DNA modification methylase
MSVLLVQGDARRLPLADASAHCTVCSPPYFALRSYGIGVDNGEIGQEERHDCNGAFTGVACGSCWICAMRAVFAEVHRVLTPTGTLWCNVGDAFTSGNRIGHSTRVGYKQQTNRGMNGTSDPPRAPQPPGLREKNLLGLPWRLALALQSDGWILRSEIIWEKPSCMPESVTDRFTRSHEHVFLFAKSPRYFFDHIAVRESSVLGTSGSDQHQQSRPTEANRIHYGPLHEQPGILCPSTGRNARTVWRINPEPLTGFQHYAAFPTELVRKCLLAGAPHAVCRACDKPWVRQVERTFRPMTDRSQEKLARASGQKGMDSSRHDHETLRGYVDTHTTGFAPSCTCAAPTQPSIVLDPFCGSGTTLLVARELGHHGVGLDLSLDYLRNIARERLGLAALSRWTDGAAPRPETHTDLPLFATLDTPASDLLC